MNYISKSLAVCLLSAVSLSAFAKELPKNMQSGKSSEQDMKMGMGMSEEMKDKKARNEQIYILKINALSDQIQDEKSAKKKQALMDEQLQLIKEHQAKKRKMMKKMMKKKMKMKMKMMNKKKSMNM